MQANHFWTAVLPLRAASYRERGFPQSQPLSESPWRATVHTLGRDGPYGEGFGRREIPCRRHDSRRPRCCHTNLREAPDCSCRGTAFADFRTDAPTRAEVDSRRSGPSRRLSRPRADASTSPQLMAVSSRSTIAAASSLFSPVKAALILRMQIGL